VSFRSLVAIACLVAACGDASSTPEPATSAPQGDWLGAAPPGTDPELFAPGVVSTGLYERDLAWTPGGDEVYWTVVAPLSRHATVVSARRLDDGTWSEPSIPGLFRGHNSLEPFVTADGAWLWFASTRPLPGEDAIGDWNLWRARRSGDGWGDAEPLPEPINGDGDEYYPSLTGDGTLYFTAERPGGLGGEDLHRSRPEGDGWSAPENLGPAINSPGPEFNSLVHPGGEWILFGSLREGDSGGGDLYVSFPTADGWSPARSLPAPLNSPALDFCPALSPDGRFLFFSSTRELGDLSAVAIYRELAELLHGPGNGQSDVYWVDVGVLESLRPTD
jgi:hypothetical protein